MLIAEIGINHNGYIDMALDMIGYAKKYGADVVKFQKRNPEICVPKNQRNKIKQTPWGDMTYIEYKHTIEFGKEEYDKIDKYCKEKGIKWTASVWDKDSLDFIMQYDVPFIKIPSALITNLKLLEYIAKTEKPIVMSTGMSNEAEVLNAVGVFMKYKNDLTVLHCNSSYPCPDNEVNLNAIKTLRLLLPPKIKIGYSGHEKGIEACLIARAFGAETIEKHVTLDPLLWGSDQAASITFEELGRLSSLLNRANNWLGNGHIECHESEKTKRLSLRGY